MAGNGVAANLFMFAILAAGLVSLSGLERESWPTIPFNHIEVSVAYPGATPDEVEESIIVKVEEQVSSARRRPGCQIRGGPGYRVGPDRGEIGHQHTSGDRRD